MSHKRSGYEDYDRPTETRALRRISKQDALKRLESDPKAVAAVRELYQSLPDYQVKQLEQKYGCSISEIIAKVR
jgi:hypothetical protein